MGRNQLDYVSSLVKLHLVLLPPYPNPKAEGNSKPTLANGI